MRPTLRRALALVGGALVLAALAWWLIVFRSVIAYDYLSLPQAGLCLGQSSSLCELAMSLCSSRVRHVLDITRNSPTALWLGLALLFASVALLPADGRAAHPTADR